MHTTPKHPSSPAVGRHPDRPAHTLVQVRQNEEPSEHLSGGFLSILKGYPLVVGITALSALLLTTVAALILSKSPDPTPWITPVAVAVLAVSALVGGIAAGKMNPSAPVAASLLCGGLTAVLLMLLSLCLGGDGDLLSWGLRVGVLPLHLLGGILTRPKSRAPVHTAGKHPTHH